MERQFWLDRWQQGQIGFHQHEVNPYLRAHWHRLGLAPGSSVFVPLCGKSRDLLWLRAQGHRVVGVELSPLAVRDFFAENALACDVSKDGLFERYDSDGITLLLGDLFELTTEMLAGCAGVFDRASLIALPPEMRSRYADKMRAIVPEQAPTLLISMDYPQQQMNGPPFAVAHDEVVALYAGSHRLELLFRESILGREPKFRERGLERLEESGYLLRPLDAAR